MTEKNAYKRYRVDKFHAKSLDNNPLNSPSDRELYIYLPPNYFESEIKYPTIYFLHGYSGNNQNMTVVPRLEDNKNLPAELIPPEILEQIDLDRVPSYLLFDELITKKELSPFIFVQSDASLHLPHKDGARDLTGEVQTKGSFYINSPFTGNYEDYIVKDVIGYVDTNYRTIPDKQHRALMGGSMGGYGTLRLCINHPEKFIVGVSLSPGNITPDPELLDWKLVVPVFEKLLGREMAEELGASGWSDILDTVDIIFSKETPFLSSIKRDKSGKIVDWDKEASTNWQKHDINVMLRERPDALKDVHLLLNCERNDEFGLTKGTQKIHETLAELEIEHQFEIYSDPRTALSPHMFGIVYNIIPGIRFCFQYFP
ncbi:MAG: alpha/beta hydrolase [Candidatus Hermodarchaeota archaeon]